ncbi:MAG: Mur ligase family protein, partial [Candidatus Limnocylindrales bacterium]
EIAELCSYLPPKVAVITAIGPVHLERMKTLERIAAAKEEILGRASIAVLNVDDPLIAPMAERFAARGRVIRVSTADRSADVYVGPTDGRLHPVIAGEAAGTVELQSLDPINVACAIGVAVALDVPVATIAKRLGSLTGAVHRREVVTSATGVSIIDDTYNSNPAGAAAALALLRSIGTPNAQRVVVTPGMVELGTIQAEENRHFAEHAAEIATTIIVVGSTNRRALTEGAAGRAATVMTVARRDDATAWVGEHLAAGDAVLYENDLPDHYP